MDKKLLPALKEDFIKYIRDAIPGYAEELLGSLDTKPSVSIRLNIRKTAAEVAHEGTTPVSWCDSGLYLPERPNFTFDPLLHGGAYYVQDASSMIIQKIISKIATGPVALLDLCAAPGGKTTAAIDALPAGSAVVANEYSSQRAEILRENLTKWGFPATIVTNSPTEKFSRCASDLDIILIDAPCSGEGMMRKDATARTQWSRSLVSQCASLQREIAASVATSLKEGAYIVYSTCTFNPEENERNVEWMAEEFGLETIEMDFPDEWGILRGIGTSAACYRFMPFATCGEGLFVSVLRKKGDAESRRTRTFKREVKKGKMADTSCRGFLTNPERYVWHLKEGRITAVAQECADILETLTAAKGIRIISEGLEVATMKGKDLVPSHQLALSTALRKESFPTAGLSLDDARKYLARETLTLDPTVPKGYVLVTYADMPLGFVKNIGNRANNLYPNNWRIRNLKL